MPVDDVYQVLVQTILRLSKLYGTPIFEPHVTFIGGLTEPEGEVTARTLRLSTLIPPFEIRLGRVDYLAEYFRCLFLRVETTPEMTKAAQEAWRVFDRPYQTNYIPHLSLMYGRLGPGVKQTIIPQVKDCSQLRFKVQSIHLFSTEGRPENWYRIRELQLA